MSVQVTVYTRPGCETCGLVKQYLDERGVRYHERDVTRDQAAAEELRAFHALGLPVTVIEGEAVPGFDKIRLDDLLKARGVSIADPD